MKTELKINGIYSFKDEENTYLIVLEKRNQNLYYLYVLDCLNECTNNEIQERLINDISNNIVRPFSFHESDSRFIHNSVDGYLGQCTDEICEKLKGFDKYGY